MPRRKLLVDQNLASKGRINFSAFVKAAYPCKRVTFESGQKGWLHRRHIVAQHVLRAAWDRVVGGGGAFKPPVTSLVKLYKAMYTEFKQEWGGKIQIPKPVDFDKLNVKSHDVATAILSLMNDNPSNLWVGNGDANSAIGVVPLAMIEIRETLEMNILSLVGEDEDVFELLDVPLDRMSHDLAMKVLKVYDMVKGALLKIATPKNWGEAPQVFLKKDLKPVILDIVGSLDLQKPLLKLCLIIQQLDEIEYNTAMDFTGRGYSVDEKAKDFAIGAALFKVFDALGKQGKSLDFQRLSAALVDFMAWRLPKGG